MASKATNRRLSKESGTPNWRWQAREKAKAKTDSEPNTESDSKEEIEEKTGFLLRFFTSIASGISKLIRWASEVIEDISTDVDDGGKVHATVKINPMYSELLVQLAKTVAVVLGVVASYVIPGAGLLRTLLLSTMNA